MSPNLCAVEGCLLWTIIENFRFLSNTKDSLTYVTGVGVSRILIGIVNDG